MRKIHTLMVMALLAVLLAVYVQPIMAQTDLPAYTGGPAELRHHLYCRRSGGTQHHRVWILQFGGMLSDWYHCRKRVRER